MFSIIWTHLISLSAFKIFTKTYIASLILKLWTLYQSTLYMNKREIMKASNSNYCNSVLIKISSQNYFILWITGVKDKLISRYLTKYLGNMRCKRIFGKYEVQKNTWKIYFSLSKWLSSKVHGKLYFSLSKWLSSKIRYISSIVLSFMKSFWKCFEKLSKYLITDARWGQEEFMKNIIEKKQWISLVFRLSIIKPNL